MKKLFYLLIATIVLISCGNGSKNKTETSIAKENQTNRVEVLYFHGAQRCITCRAIEAHDPINEMLKQLYQMINQLGQLDKSIILLYLEDKSYEEIAEITGLTVTNIATKLSRIKDKLKRMKKEE